MNSLKILFNKKNLAKINLESYLFNFNNWLINNFFKNSLKIKYIRYDIIIKVGLSYLFQLLYFLKYNTYCQFKMLIDITAVDYIKKKRRFKLVYNLLSLKFNRRLQVHVDASELSLVPSITELYANSGWYEREVWDMFGIFFTNHPDLRRILTDYGFEGFPLRKDFPLTGYVEVRYDDEQKRVISEALEIDQLHRSSYSLQSWKK